MNRGVALIAGLVLALPASIPAARGQCMIWTLRTDVGGPGPQTRHCMVYNPDRRRIVLFGSDDFADLWEYDGLRWLRVFVTGPRPSPRVDAAMAYDAVRRELVLVGGFGRAENDYLADTWTCRFSTDATGNVVGAWTRRQDFPDYAEPDPEDASGQMGESGARAEHSLVYDDVAGVVHLFGGRARIIRGARYQRPFNRKNYSSGSGMWNGNAWVRRRWNDTRARAPIDIDWPTGLPGTFLNRLELGRKAIAATFDGLRGQIVTFGGLRQIYQRRTDGSIQDSTVEEAYVESIPHLQATTPRFDNQAFENFPGTATGLLYTSRENRCGNPMDNRVFGARIVHDSRRDRYVAFGGAYVGGDFRRDVECSPYYSVDSSDHVSRLVSLANTFRTWDPNKPRGNDAFGNLRIPIDYVGSFNGAGPAARVDHTMAYDAHRGVTVMYGGWTGASSDLTSMASETWEFGPNPATVGFLREPPERLELCLGETLALEVVPLQPWPNPRGTPPSLNEIRWFRDDSPIPSGTNAALVVENVDRSHAGEYRCEMIDPCGNVTVGRTTRVLVGGPPVIVQAPFSRHVCPGDASELRVLFQSDYPPTVQWFRVDLDLAGAASLAAQSSIPGADGNVLAFPSAKPSDNGYYRVRIANRCGTVWSTPVEFTAGVWLKRQANSSTNAVCTATELAVLASGKGRLRYAWRRNGEPLAASERVAGVDGPNLRFASLRYLDDAAYDCLVGDACHTVTTRVASVSVVPNPPFLLVDTHGPSARQRHAMVYDSLRGVTVLFGGIGATPEAGNFYRNDTWEYDGSRWTRRTPADAPSPRADFGMTYDRHRGRVVLFGGSKADPSSGRISDGETWEYDGTNWLRVLAEKSPAPRFNHTLFYDPVRRVTTLYGGDTSLANPRAGDIWVWDGVRWTERTLSGDRPAFGSTGSPPRPQMIWDERRGYAVLPPTTLNFGGSQDRATWTWDGTNWTRRVYVYEAFGRSPGQAGSGLGLVYDTFRGEVIYWSGDAFDQAYVWRWNGENWRRDDIPEWIGLHLYAGAAYDSRRHAVVLFGGNYTGSGVVPQGLSPRTFERVLADEPIFLRQSSLVDEPSRPARYLRVVAAGAPPLTFTWQRDGTNLLESFPFSGTRTDTLAVDRGLATDAAQYRCVVRGPCGEATSLAIDLAGRVEPLPTTLALALDTRPTPGGPGIALTWTGTGVVLERAPRAAGPWVAIPEATSPYRPVLNEPSAFYRLRGP